MKITIERLKELKPCEEGFKWYLENIKTENLEDVLLQVNKHDALWARWLFTNLMTKEQNVRIAIFSARLVLHFFEEKYPTDDRPRKAIETAEKYLTAEASGDAARAAWDAAEASGDAGAAALLDTQEKIIREAVRILATASEKGE